MDIPDFMKPFFDGTAFVPGNQPSQKDDCADIAAFEDAIEECTTIFLERRKQYGNHLERSKQYHASAIHLKMDRAIKDIESSRTVKRDTLIDLACYCLMLLSYRHAKGG